MEPWVSIDEVAAHIRVRKDSIYRWIESRGLPATKVGKLCRLKLTELDSWMPIQRIQPVDPRDSKPDGLPKSLAPGASKPVLVVDHDELVRDTVYALAAALSRQLGRVSTETKP